MVTFSPTLPACARSRQRHRRKRQIGRRPLRAGTTRGGSTAARVPVGGEEGIGDGEDLRQGQGGIWERGWRTYCGGAGGCGSGKHSRSSRLVEKPPGRLTMSI